MKAWQLKRQHQLENEIESLRQHLGVSARGETLFHAPRSMWSATDVVAEADEKGAAKLIIVEGNYPDDYTTHKVQSFLIDDEACDAPERLIAPTKTSSLSSRQRHGE